MFHTNHVLSLGALALVAATPLVPTAPQEATTGFGQQVVAGAATNASAGQLTGTVLNVLAAGTSSGTLTLAAHVTPADPLGLPDPVAPLTLAEGSPSLEDLVHAFERSVGSIVLKNAQVCNQAANDRLSLGAALNVPENEVYSFFESVLLQHGYYLSFLKGGAVPTFAVHSLQNSHPSSYRWLEVTGAQLDALNEHPALLVSCALDFERCDVRQLANNLRVTTNSQSSLVVASGERTLFLRGTGAFVSEVGRVARQSDAATPPPIEPTQVGPAGAVQQGR